MKKLSLLLVLVLLLSACAPEAPTEKSDLKIVSLAPSLTEIVYALDLGDNLVGRSDFDNYPAEVDAVESFGSLMEPDIEKIISLQPDYAIHVFDNPDLSSQLTEAGIEVVQFEQVDTVEETYGVIERVGALFGKEDKAKEVTAQMKDKIAGIQEKVAGAEPTSVYYVVGFGPDGDFTATGETFIHDMMTIAGGDNIAKDAAGWSYNLENLLAADPEIIITSDQWDMKPNFMAAENYDQLTAVKEDRVFEVNPDLLERQGPRIVDGIETMAKILHPDLFE